MGWFKKEPKIEEKPRGPVGNRAQINPKFPPTMERRLERAKRIKAAYKALPGDHPKRAKLKGEYHALWLQFEKERAEMEKLAQD